MLFILKESISNIALHISSQNVTKTYISSLFLWTHFYGRINTLYRSVFKVWPYWKAIRTESFLFLIITFLIVYNVKLYICLACIVPFSLFLSLVLSSLVYACIFVYLYHSGQARSVGRQYFTFVLHFVNSFFRLLKTTFSAITITCNKIRSKNYLLFLL